MQARTMWLGFKSEAPMRCGDLAVVEQVMHTNIEIDIVGKVMSKEAVAAHRLGLQ